MDVLAALAPAGMSVSYPKEDSTSTHLLGTRPTTGMTPGVAALFDPGRRVIGRALGPRDPQRPAPGGGGGAEASPIRQNGPAGGRNLPSTIGPTKQSARVVGAEQGGGSDVTVEEVSAPAEFFITAGLFVGLFGALFLAVMLVSWLYNLPRKRREQRERAG
jgi:hypothetical protein